jgi:hypothetical protein
MFNGRSLVVATKHEKEKVIAPILEKELGVKCFVASNFDTDELGTFTGEVERKYDPLTTVKNKCLLAMEINNCDLAIASEGSFGPHPSLYFIPANDELLLFIDKKNSVEIIARELSTETNFNSASIKTKQELNEFSAKANFPSHGLILRPAKDDFTQIVKGITNIEKLNRAFNYFISNFGSAFIETDMRAMYNPSRMKVIERAAIKLVEKINSLCPNCSMPGFEITNTQKGLPCNQCNFPTQSTFSYIYTCKKCFFIKEEKFPKGKLTEDPMYCDVCNP